MVLAEWRAPAGLVLIGRVLLMVVLTVLKELVSVLMCPMFAPFSVSCCLSPVPEEKYLTLEGFHRFTVDRAKQDIRSVWRAILACGYDLHFERLAL